MLSKAIMAASFVVLLGGNILIMLFWPDRLWLVIVPIVLWGLLFLAFSVLTVKDPKYYG
jgi:hypothetical protein